MAIDAYRVDENGCWKWDGKLLPKGYGRIGSGSVRAHRVYYERYKGPIPKGLWVLHKCDVKDCVNPEHLYIGTHTDNMRDASERGQLHSPARLAAMAANGKKAAAASAVARKGTSKWVLVNLT